MIKSLLILTFATISIAVRQPHGLGSPKYATTLRKLQNRVRQQGCKVNVCFAIDTSGSLSIDEFDLLRFFMVDISAIAGESGRSRFTAFQYGRRAYRMSKLTSYPAIFNENIDDALFINHPVTNIVSGLQFCGASMRRHRGDSNHVVLIANGKNKIETYVPYIASEVRHRREVVISAIGVGIQDTETLIGITGDASRVFTVDDYDDLVNAEDKLLQEICGFSFIEN